MIEILKMLVGLYTIGVISTLICFATGRIGLFTEKRKTYKRFLYITNI